jgi:hypothetical protein
VSLGDVFSKSYWAGQPITFMQELFSARNQAKRTSYLLLILFPFVSLPCCFLPWWKSFREVTTFFINFMTFYEKFMKIFYEISWKKSWNISWNVMKLFSWKKSVKCSWNFMKSVMHISWNVMKLMKGHEHFHESS